MSMPAKIPDRGSSNYLDVTEVRQFVKEWATKVLEPKRQQWFTNTVGSCLLASVGVTYRQKRPLPELPARPPHELATAVELVAWEAQVAEVKKLRQSEESIQAATQGHLSSIRWAHPICGRYLNALLSKMVLVPNWVTQSVAENRPIHAFMPGDDLEAVLAEVVEALNSPLPEMKRLTYRQFDQMLTFVRNLDLGRRVGQIARDLAAARLREDPSHLKGLGLRRVLDFPCGHYWVQLVPTPDELSGSVAPFAVKGPETRTAYRSLLEECDRMSNGQGVAHFCISNGVYDGYLEGEGRILSLRDSENRPHVTIAIRNDGSIDQLQGRCNSVPKAAYFGHIWAMSKQFPLKSSESSGSQAHNVGLVGVDGWFVPVTALPPGARVTGSLTFRDCSVALVLPEALTVEGSMDIAGTKVAALPVGLTVQGDCTLKKCPLTELPARLKVGRRLDISDTSISTLPPDLDAEVLFCGSNSSVPEAAVREFLLRTKLAMLVKPKFKRHTTGAADAATDAQVELAWQKKLAFNENLWAASLPAFEEQFRNRKDGNIGQCVDRVYGR